MRAVDQLPEQQEDPPRYSVERIAIFVAASVLFLTNLVLAILAWPMHHQVGPIVIYAIGMFSAGSVLAYLVMW